jgi:predicted DsbA family dithiol-disulfide isomerase
VVLNLPEGGAELVSRLTSDVWADILCPWCYLGEQRLGVAIEKSAHAGEIDLRIHTFELDPTGADVCHTMKSANR